jgi:probable DNA metabolism protein
MMDARLANETDIEGFREETRMLLAHQVPPDEVHWMARAENSEQFADAAPALKTPGAARSASAIVPASFQRLCDVVVLHHDPERFALLYRLLWRLVHEPGLRNNPIDADMLHAHQMGQSVRRDLHKMKAFLRFRSVKDESGTPRQLAWYEPAHHIVEAVAPWFAQRTAHPRWAIFTPERSVECDGTQLHFGRGVARNEAPCAEADDAAWLGCYGAVFPK